MRIQRIDDIEQYIQENGSVSLDDLCEKFGISKVTLRRDLDKLTEKGTVKKVYGGVIAIQQKENVEQLLPYEERNIKNCEEKRRIAKLAAAQVEDHDVIFIDTGTSTYYMVDYLTHITGLTVITNSIMVASRLISCPQIRTMILPGMLNTQTASAVGNSCQEYLRQCHIQKAFMACTALNENGASNSSPEEYEIKKIALEQSRVHCLLADHTKFDRSALMVYSPLGNIHQIFTDVKPAQKYTDLFKKENIILNIAE